MDRGEFPHLTDSQFESVRKMVGIFGGDNLRSLAAATPVGRMHRGVRHAPVVELKPAQSKPSRLKLNPYEGEEGENLHFWRGRARDGRGSNLDRMTSDRFRPVQPRRSGEGLGVYARGDNAGLFQNLGSALRASFLPANYEYRQRSRFLVCKRERELHEYIQEMRVLAASLVGNPPT
ncbi:LOW QUALITY PROTEIN: Gag protein [Phytophthora palmivora]|uniref:Gag protein n=1 Tax=Phytophthora palmivora TaxID=4796 RepID=A0A2P4YAZ9_9STRA|nr:LOW QUALITY PROTEIN: Gag protein [Phytophthora palmivora]